MSGNGIAELFAAYLNEAFLQVLHAAATLLWLLEKVAAGLQRFLTEENLWEILLAGTLDTLKNTMPGILGSVVFGGSSGVGMLYLALMLAGLLLILPSIGNTRLVEPGRVLMWGMVLASLFIGATWGYDLIGYLEEFRQGMAQTLVTGMGGESADLDALIRTPMYASSPETETYDFTLPAEFEAHYFQEPRYPDDYTTYTLVIGVWPVQHSWTVWAESTQSQEARRATAQTGLAVALLTLIPAVVLLLFGLIFAALAAAALVLILFFVVALPLGFFEFGTHLLTHIVRQYVYLFAITLLAVVLMAIVVALSFLQIESTSPAEMPNRLMGTIPALVAVLMALSYVTSMATSTMKASFGTVSTSVRASMSSLNVSGAMPAGSGVLSDAAQAAMNVTGAAALAGATGGLGAALVAGGGSALGHLSPSAGRAAATLVQATNPEGHYSQLFGTAARTGGRGGLGGIASVAASGVGGRRRGQMRRAQLETSGALAFSSAAQKPKDAETDEFPWRGVDEGTFHAADSDLIEQGMKEYRAGARTTARSTFAQAFGSRGIAEQVMGRLQTDPLQQQLPVAEITAQTRRTAHQTVQAGKALFDTQGNLTPTFHGALWQNFRADPALKHLNLQDTSQLQFVGAIAGASVRPTQPIWNDPQATRKLAQAVLEPESAQIATQDHAALLSLQGLAHIEGWETEQLEALFEATRSGQSASALAGGKEPVSGIVKALYSHRELQNLDMGTAKSAAQLALLVTRGGQSVRNPQPIPGPTETPVVLPPKRTPPEPLVPPTPTGNVAAGVPPIPVPVLRPTTPPRTPRRTTPPEEES